MNMEIGAGGESPLNEGGSYAIQNLPLGEYKVLVLPGTELGKAEAKGAIVHLEKNAPDIPPKYRVIGTTDLRATVKEGENQVDFNMKR